MHNSFKILIAEDDVLISESLSQHLKGEGYHIVDIVASASEAIKILQTQQVDLAILDINMNGAAQGFEIAEFMHKNSSTPFVFLTSYADDKIVDKATQYHPAGYLVKPFNVKTVFSTVKLALVNASLAEDNTIQFKQAQTITKIPLKELLFVKADDVYINVVTVNKAYLVRSSLKHFLEENPFNSLIQTHRSYVVNKNKVTEISASKLLVNNTEVPVSRSYSSAVKKACSRD